jgi:uncharacterized protein (DUF1501 family)
MLKRRAFLAAASASMLSLPLLGSHRGSDRKFLFIFADGGWDTTKAFTPMFGRASVDMEAHATLANENGITFTDSELRPAVRTFFETYGDRACVVNGIEVPEITHARCRRLAFTGLANAGGAAWGETLGAHARGSVLAPYLALLGPSSTRLPGGSEEPLPSWLDGALEGCGDGGRSRADRSTASDAMIALDCFERGITRCAAVRNSGWLGAGWDTHTDDGLQEKHFEQLFGSINAILADLDARTATDGSRLSEQVTIVVMSEMGRAPKLNARGGRDHGRFTSAMLVGSGIRGGQVVGEMDESFRGRPVDLASGEATDAGTLLAPGHLGATLLALGDVAPASAGLAERPIEAVLA